LKNQETGLIRESHLGGETWEKTKFQRHAETYGRIMEGVCEMTTVKEPGMRPGGPRYRHKIKPKEADFHVN